MEAAPAIHQADTGPIPPFDSKITRPPILQRRAPAPPRLVALRSEQTAMGATEVRTVIEITLTPGHDPTALITTHFQVEYRRLGGGTAWLPGGTVTAQAATVRLTAVGVRGTLWEVRARSVNADYSVASAWVTLEHMVSGGEPLNHPMRWR